MKKKTRTKFDIVREKLENRPSNRTNLLGESFVKNALELSDNRLILERGQAGDDNDIAQILCLE